MSTVAKINNGISGKETSVLKLLANFKGEIATDIVEREDAIFFIDDKFVAKLDTV